MDRRTGTTRRAPAPRALVRPSARPAGRPLESLEPRRLLAATLAGSTLTVTGTSANDSIRVEFVTQNGAVVANDGVKVTINGDVQTFDYAAGLKLRVYGLAGNDHIETVENHDVTTVRSTLRGGDGDDTIVGGCCKDRIFGDAGDDVLRGGNQHDTIYGGAGDDSIYGSAHRDLLDGGEGDDYVWGDGGEDRVRGGVGADHVLGGHGNDEVWGGGGRDKLYGDGGNDRLFGDAGNDLLCGGSDNDALWGGSGNDVLNGNDGKDTVFGQDGLDELNS